MAERDGDALFAFLMGGLIGAGLALLVAPTEGAETRRRVLDWLRKAEDKGERFLKEQGRMLAERGREVLEGRGHPRPGADGEDA